MDRIDLVAQRVCQKSIQMKREIASLDGRPARPSQEETIDV